MTQISHSIRRAVTSFTLAAAAVVSTGCATTPQSGCEKQEAMEKFHKNHPALSTAQLILGGAIIYGQYVRQCESGTTTAAAASAPASAPASASPAPSSTK